MIRLKRTGLEYHDNPPTVLSNIKSVNKPIKIQRIFFSFNDNSKDTLNFDHIIKSVKKTLNLWKWRNLTICGKIQIIKTFIIPKISYRTNIINLGPKRLKEINSLLFNFIWNGKDKLNEKL